jgi:hypothetical protein
MLFGLTSASGQLLLFEPSFCGLKSLSAIPQIPAILVID